MSALHPLEWNQIFSAPVFMSVLCKRIQNNILTIFCFMQHRNLSNHKNLFLSEVVAYHNRQEFVPAKYRQKLAPTVKISPCKFSSDTRLSNPSIRAFQLNSNCDIKGAFLSFQTSYPDEQAVPQSLPQSSLPQNDLSPAAQKVSSDAGAAHSSELHGDAAAFKPLSSGSIWSPVGSQPLSSTLTVVCDEEHCDKQGWNNSDSTSSSRSSSRQELSSIMDSENAAGTNVWNSSAFAEDLTPTPQEHSMEFDPSLRGQGLSSVTHWGSNRGAFSAPSSPSLQRTQPNPEVAPPWATSCG